MNASIRPRGPLTQMGSGRLFACAGCKAQGLCSDLGRTNAAPPTHDPAQATDLAALIQPSAPIRAALLAYLMPAVGLSLGALLLAEQGDGAAAMGAALGLALGLGLLRPLTRFLAPISGRIEDSQGALDRAQPVDAMGDL